jgi:sulfur carrier protein
MNIVVNGNKHELGGAGALGQLLKELEIVSERVAVMVNDRIVPKAARGEFVLKEGDRVEILTFIGGG